MGVVWAAVNERTEREVALKLINGENDGLRRRLLREAKACGRLVHRNIIEIYDVGETDEGEPFLVMPLLSGETLADRLGREGLFAPPLAARIALDIARGLAVAHGAGIVHRDLKPANVFLHREPGGDDSFVVKVLDFGVSKMVNPADATTATQAGGAVGSPLYMSPEQALGDAGVGPPADLWAVGVLLYEMLTGTRPFYASTAFAVVAKILRGPIPTVVERAPGVDPALGAVVSRLLVRRPADRLGSAADLRGAARALRRRARAGSGLGAAARVRSRVRRRGRRDRLLPQAAQRRGRRRGDAGRCRDAGFFRALDLRRRGHRLGARAWRRPDCAAAPARR